MPRIFRTTIVPSGDRNSGDDNAPYVSAKDNFSRITEDVLQEHADNADVVKDVVGVNHLVLVVHPTYWHIAQYSGYTREDGLFLKVIED